MKLLNVMFGLLYRTSSFMREKRLKYISGNHYGNKYWYLCV